MARTSLTSESPSAVTMMSASKRVGNTINMSEARMISVSIVPPRTPAKIPAAPPNTKLQSTETRPI